MYDVFPLTQLRSRLDRAIGQHDSLQTRLNTVTLDIDRLLKDEDSLGLVAELFRQMIDQEVTLGVQAVERLQTEGLQAVFDDQDLSVKARVETSRGKVSVDLVTNQVYPNGMVVEGLSSDSFGGSVATVQSVLLRLIVILRRGLHPLLLLDESLPAFDDNYVVNMGQFLSILCSRLGLDILLVTHNPELVGAADRAYRIVKKDGAAKFEVLRGIS